MMSMFAFENKLYVFGGMNFNNYKACNDFHGFCVKTQCWKELSKAHKDYEFTPRMK
jgi:N-acetylneuraminic acid mutarotase